MIRNFMLCAMLLSASLFAKNSPALKKNVTFVSLGNNCWTAQALRAAGLRDRAFPFDWLFSLDNEGLNRALDDDFQNFTNSDFFSPDNYDCISVRNNYYGVVFTHDWPFSDHQMSPDRYNYHLDVIKTKYDRRIARFRQLREYSGKAFFFRTFSTHPDFKGEYGWNTEKAKKLKSSLDRYFPNLDFTLVILSCSDENIPEIDTIDGVLEYKISELRIQDKYLPMFNELLTQH